MHECIRLAGDDFALLLKVIAWAGVGPALVVFVVMLDWSAVEWRVRRHFRCRRLAAIRAVKAVRDV